MGVKSFFLVQSRKFAKEFALRLCVFALNFSFMRWTQTLIPTLREAPADAEIVSHKLLLRAGLIRKLAGGVYTFLPLAARAPQGGADCPRGNGPGRGDRGAHARAPAAGNLGAERSRRNREQCFVQGKGQLRRQWFLSPTAEEVITTLAANEINSYRQLPKNLYQISVKFRDEIRPRFGLMRAKEFIMKDAYSFDTTDEGAMATTKKCMTPTRASSRGAG